MRIAAFIALVAILIALVVGIARAIVNEAPAQPSLQESTEPAPPSSDASAQASAPAGPLAVGDPLPALTLTDAGGTAVNLRAAVAEQPVVLIFYRGGWCPYCNTHLAELGAGHEQIAATGWQVIAISPDAPEQLAATNNKHHLPYRLLSDADASAIRAFGLAFTVDEATRDKYRGYNIDLEAASGHSHYQLPHPAVYLVDQSGTIRYAHHNQDYKQRLSLAQVLSAIGAAMDQPAPSSDAPKPSEVKPQ
ncbi:MAG: peroxiredoxin-like family protein [Planctomycetota bacterium]|nr:peroxiredoxin-like family protein [Planctomycetota bacterium]